MWRVLAGVTVVARFAVGALATTASIAGGVLGERAMIWIGFVILLRQFLDILSAIAPQCSRHV